MKNGTVKVKSKLDGNHKEDEDIKKISEPVKGYFKAGENSVVNLSCKTRVLARILEEKSHLEKNKKD
ncbi:MAG: hypothetical protein PWR06_2700 [Thermoanaerobacteraceae bacterium]|jgi:hypothetical protein|uniref:Uncharacterized protein n=1 Tax=Biomaibacter acetigenes TaxID=2316383 RepID=A0A3G2R6J1_9FIRM|nr:hypothetical protein [Biomaibacter acetigenes]MDK2879984.1 hypothetical protein [Thermoanaerobacteraceae bacterium]RKL63939.1 hypothetical protein DXT63_04210 [Thermoanaerobacteraceae bacterium SP2]AYO30985.1 hypothetical protein D2962_10535 [Biomaibacter acetigenes]MDN5302460.1 hypothetical protein [Thermoanaerobacteraceae bacterium]MDN5311038.1 hypothetical protein [Thermoanaerobacteraceae bacterium]